MDPLPEKSQKGSSQNVQLANKHKSEGSAKRSAPLNFYLFKEYPYGNMGCLKRQ